MDGDEIDTEALAQWIDALGEGIERGEMPVGHAPYWLAAAARRLRDQAQELETARGLMGDT